MGGGSVPFVTIFAKGCGEWGAISQILFIICRRAFPREGEGFVARGGIASLRSDCFRSRLFLPWAGPEPVLGPDPWAGARHQARRAFAFASLRSVWSNTAFFVLSFLPAPLLPFVIPVHTFVIPALSFRLSRPLHRLSREGGNPCEVQQALTYTAMSMWVPACAGKTNEGGNDEGVRNIFCE